MRHQITTLLLCIMVSSVQLASLSLSDSNIPNHVATAATGGPSPSRESDVDINEGPRDETIDEIIEKADEAADTKDFFKEHPDEILLEGDIIVPRDDWDKRTKQTQRRKKRSVAWARNKWTNNRIPHQIILSHFTVREIATIRSARRDWEKYTCLTFPRARSGGRVVIRSGRGCTTPTGMDGRGRPQYMYLGRYCRVKPIVLHEFGHAIGLWHEMGRPDRDKYIRIIDKNIRRGDEAQFKAYTSKDVKTYDIPYDYFSIMHYGKNVFSKKPNLITIETIDKRFQDVIGNVEYLSFRDIKTVNLMYNCSKANRCQKSDTDCPGEGFVGKDCKCWCPADRLSDVYKYCHGDEDNAVEGATVFECRDQENPAKCYQWASDGDCQKYPIYMRLYCNQTCNFCGGELEKNDSAVPSIVKPKCVNKHELCPIWAKQGECEKHPVYMREVCKHSCRQCDSADEDNKSNCTNNHESCEVWALLGECEKNEEYMHNVCKLSCKICAGTKSDEEDGPVICKDNKDDCHAWAVAGECNRNPKYMHNVCKLSCKKCEANSVTIPTPCTDEEYRCSKWAERGECRRNPRYMLVNCKLSCKQCKS